MTHEELMREALREAQKAFDDGEIPVGAVIAHGGEVIARAHNLREATGDPTAHAEVLAIREAAAKLGATVKLVARGIVGGEEPLAMVAPFIVINTKFLSAVSGVYNAIEVIAEPLGDVMFYGQGAGGGTTASAVVGDLVQVMSTGINYTAPVFEKTEPKVLFESFSSRHYLSYKPENFEKIEHMPLT